MSILKEFYGKMPDGTDVYRYTLENKNGMRLKALNYGGVVTELWTPDRNGCFTDIIGGYDCLQTYLDAPGFQGALVGRVANRIKDAKFTLDGVEYQLNVTEAGGHQLHGGKVGFNAKIWDVKMIDEEEPSLELHLLSPDGDENYPGNLDLTVTYTVTNENSWKIRYVATTDKATIINLTNHAYFNLGGYASGSIHSMQLMIDADTYLPIDETLIPTGELKSVEGTPFDFRTPKKIGTDIKADDKDLLIAGGYDHCFNFVGGKTDKPIKRAELYDAESGRVMEVITNQPCIQFYSGNFLNDPEFSFKGGYKQSVQTLLCLETQHMPDSINHENFTDCTLSPDEVYDFTTEYRFSVK